MKKTIYVFLISMILLGTILTLKLLPITSFGADTKAININNTLEKYINYYLSEEDKGTIVQYNLETKIEYGEKGKIPVEESEIEINLSKIDNKYPQEVKVISQNGYENSNQYNPTTGILTIQTNEQKEEEKSNYILICYYDTYTQETPQRDLETKVVAKSIFADDKEIVVSKEEQYKDTVTENIGKLTSIDTKTQDIYNGYMKSNKINGTKYITEYEQINQIMISKKEAQKTIEMQEKSNFVSQEQELKNNNDIIYKSTKIEEKTVKNILGEEGKIEFLDEEGNIIDTIDKETRI